MKPILIWSAGGDIIINENVEGRFFKVTGIGLPTNFYILPELKIFDSTIGDDTLTQLAAIVDPKWNLLILENIIHIPLKEKMSAEINYVPDDLRVRFDKADTVVCLRWFGTTFSVQIDWKLIFRLLLEASIFVFH